MPRASTTSPIAAVSFDLFGTCILPRASIGALYAEMAAECGVNSDGARLQAEFVDAFRSVSREWRVPYGAGENDARYFWFAVIRATFTAAEAVSPDDVCCERIFTGFGEAENWRILPGVENALAMLAERGVPRYICSNFDSRARRICAGLGLDDFAGVMLSSEVGRAKPDPAMLYAIAEHAGCRAEDILHIGDSAHEDGAACDAAGVRYCAVERGAGIDAAELHSHLSRG